MGEYIKRVDALKAATLAELDVDFVIEAIRHIPAADVRPVVHARWEFKGQNVYHKFFVCSNCKELVDGQPNFCPNCGADMREVTPDG